MCVELWKYPQTIISRTEPIERWDHTDTEQKNCLWSISRNPAGQLGLLRGQGTSFSTFFELRDANFELLNSFDFFPNCIDAIYPFGDHHWFLQGSSGQTRSGIHSKRTNSSRCPTNSPSVSKSTALSQSSWRTRRMNCSSVIHNCQILHFSFTALNTTSALLNHTFDMTTMFFEVYGGGKSYAGESSSYTGGASMNP